MKRMMATLACGSLIVAANAQGGDADVPAPAPEPQERSWGDWGRPLDGSRTAPSPMAPPLPQEPRVEREIDVADAHWMALTMWGEARGQGEEGMLAVGHVIHNRWRSRGQYGAYVTDTVSQAWQFSCWNPEDPNRHAMLNIHALPVASRDYRLWLNAKQLAYDILQGHSADPTGGALFYHTTDVAPRWSEGVTPVRQIGNHLFFSDAN